MGWDPIGSVLAYSTYTMPMVGPQPALFKLGVVVLCWKSLPWGRRSRKFKHQGRPRFPREFGFSLGYTRDVSKVCLYVLLLSSQTESERARTHIVIAMVMVCCMLCFVSVFETWLLPVTLVGLKTLEPRMTLNFCSSCLEC